MWEAACGADDDGAAKHLTEPAWQNPVKIHKKTYLKAGSLENYTNLQFFIERSYGIREG